MIQEKAMGAMDKKAYEIAYALCRIAEKAGEPLGGILSQKGLQLLAAVVENDFEAAGRLVSALGYFMKLGAGLDRMSQANVDVLIGQLNLLTGLLYEESNDAALSGSASVSNVDLSDIFSGEPEEPSVHPAKQDVISHEAPMRIAEYPATSEQKKEPSEFQAQKSFADGDSGESSFAPLISSDIRQSEILDLIRQSGNCRMKDLQDMFPRCSERTLRYDIESLISRKLIERIGAGSATSYQPADLASV